MKRLSILFVLIGMLATIPGCEGDALTPPSAPVYRDELEVRVHLYGEGPVYVLNPAEVKAFLAVLATPYEETEGHFVKHSTPQDPDGRIIVEGREYEVHGDSIAWMGDYYSQRHVDWAGPEAREFLASLRKTVRELAFPDQEVRVIHDLWKDLAVRHMTVAGIEYQGIGYGPPWTSTRSAVQNAWDRLTHPKNLNALVKWVEGGKFRPFGRAEAEEALRQCKERGRK